MGMLADRFDGFLLDLDGVVYVGDQPLPGAGAAITALRAAGKQILFLTNDPRHSREAYAARLRRLGIAASASDVLTSGAATAAFLREHEQPEGQTAYVIGSAALKAELAAVGLRIVEGEAGRSAAFVIVGGHEGFNYQELRIAAQAARRGARLYATNRDATFPMPDGPWPAVGAIVAAVETAADRQAVGIGKPAPHMFHAARSLLRAERLVVVGDSPATDIAGGRRAGLATILVAPAGHAHVSEGDHRPDFVVRGLVDLIGTRQS
jgi:glycerol 3-phosphatase-2